MSNIPVEPPNSNTYEIWTEKFKTLKSSYQERLNELGKRFKTICLNISSDAIINQLRSDHTTVEFVKDRMAEIVQECMHDEKESVIAALQSECAEYRSEIFTIRTNQDNMIERLKSQDAETAKIKIEYEKELKSTQVAYQVRESELQQILGIKEKDIQELDHRLKISKDSIVEYESTLRKSKNEIDECKGLIQEYKKNADVLNETISVLELDKNKLMLENEQLQKDLEKTLDERDVLRDKLNDAADKFEHTFTKQEDAYESQYKDMKDKHKKLKAKMVEDRAKFEVKLNEERKLFEEKISDDMAKHEVKLANEKKKCEDEITRIKNEQNNSMNQSNLEMQNLKNKYESNLSSKSQELIYEQTTRIKQLEMKQSEQKEKVEYQQTILKNDYIHNENHTQILQRDLQDKEFKIKEQQESIIKSKEDKLNEIIVNLKARIENEAVTYNNQSQDFKLELESKSYQQKETIAKQERQFEEEVEKRQKLSENLNENVEKCRLLLEEKHSLETKLINESNELNNIRKENSRLAEKINNLNNSEVSLNKSLEMFKGQLNDAKLENDKNILLISKHKEHISDLNLKLEDSNNKINDQKSISNDLKAKLDNLNDLLEQEKHKVFLASVNNKKEQVTLREEFSEKVENESRAHRDTVFKLHQSELEVKALESKLYGSLEKLQHAKNEITALINENKSYKEKEILLEDHNKELNSEISKNLNHYNTNINKLKNKSVTFMQSAIKKIQLLKNEIYNLKNECNQDKVRIESNTLMQNINNKIFKVFKDLKYSNLKECKQLRELCNNECLVNVQEKCNQQEALIDGHYKDQQQKLKIKDDSIKELNIKCSNLEKQVERCSDQEKQINKLEIKENQLLSDLNAQAEKLTLLKELTENEQEKHKETLNNMKKDFTDHVKERENQLYKEFEQILESVESKFASRFKTLLESNANFSEYALDLQCDLDNISIETLKQTEYLQTHHNDYLVYNNNVIQMLKRENEDLKESLDETERKQGKILHQFEEKFLDMSKKSNQEMDFFNKQKQDKALDQENLERKLREYKSQLHESELKIQRLTREKDHITASIKNDDTKLINEKLQMDSVLRSKDREIQELHSLLEKNQISGAETLKSVNKLRSSHLDASYNIDVQNNQSVQSQGHINGNNKSSSQGNQMLKSTQRN